MPPGSHRNTTPLPDRIHENVPELGYAYEKARTNNILPNKLVNLAPNAGDVIIASDQICHGGLKWKPKERKHRFLLLRYEPQYIIAWRTENDITYAKEVLDVYHRSQKNYSPGTRWSMSKISQQTRVSS